MAEDINENDELSIDQNVDEKILKEDSVDEIDFDVKAGSTLDVSIYLKDCTQMNSGTLITGPLSSGQYAYGDFADQKTFPIDLCRNTNWFYFLNTIDVLTEEQEAYLNASIVD